MADLGLHTFTLGTRTITLSRDWYNARGQYGQLGYERVIPENQFVTVEYNQRMSALLRGFSITDFMREELRFSLLMPPESADILEAMMKFQRSQIGLKVSVANISIRVDDLRCPIVEPEPRTHASIGSLLAAPISSVKYYARFDAVFTSWDRSKYIVQPGCELDEVEFTMLESQATIPIVEDLP